MPSKIINERAYQNASSELNVLACWNLLYDACALILVHQKWFAS